ncbi:hypothetical protein RJ640_007073 [Escallonia rubra]|uniref:Pentatricopeptide repeat-containing protein n=1 Tax=Escallonia rubra TaxID=112253 RepID=A0AA88QMC3_9ASTE|nr:hypothetical protein RJ640_007072 [Escallonia rubra]KAK2979930.1 hypothetical protein RJ640_007073 [Escallonia rubra]
MAIPTSSDWSLACSHCSKKTHRHTFNPTCNFIPHLSLLSSDPRFAITNSSGCPSPILENESTHQPAIQMDLKIQDFLTSGLPETEDLNGFICTLFKNPQTGELAYNYYEKAKEIPEFIPRKVTLKHLIRLISTCTKARKVKLVNNLLDVLKNNQEVAVSAFDTAMRGYNKLHMYRSTIVTYRYMESAGIVLDSGCFSQIMEAFQKIGNHNKVVALFEEYEKRKMGLSPITTEIYRILCESLSKSGRPFEALEHFNGLRKQGGFQEEPSFYTSLICSFASIGEVKVAEELLEEGERKRMLRDPAVFLKLVVMYVGEGMLEKTLDVVAMMKRVKIRVSDCIFCAIVNGYSKKRGLMAAIKVYEDLVLDGCEPGQVTYASILNVYCRIGLYAKAEEVFYKMDKMGYDKCVVAYSSMVAMYGKTGRVREATRLVAKMKEKGCEPNVWVYNALMDMHGKVLNLRQVEKTWNEMKRRKVVPDKVSYTSIISAYNKAREFDCCVKFYEEYRLNGGVIDRAMAGIMVGVFSKMSRIDELVKLLQDLKTQGTRLDGRLYRSSLNALRDSGLQVHAKWFQQGFEAT